MCFFKRKEKLINIGIRHGRETDVSETTKTWEMIWYYVNEKRTKFDIYVGRVHITGNFPDDGWEPDGWDKIHKYDNFQVLNYLINRWTPWVEEITSDDYEDIKCLAGDI